MVRPRSKQLIAAVTAVSLGSFLLIMYAVYTAMDSLCFDRNGGPVSYSPSSFARNYSPLITNERQTAVDDPTRRSTPMNLPRDQHQHHHQRHHQSTLHKVIASAMSSRVWGIFIGHSSLVSCSKSNSKREVAAADRWSDLNQDGDTPLLSPSCGLSTVAMRGVPKEGEQQQHQEQQQQQQKHHQHHHHHYHHQQHQHHHQQQGRRVLQEQEPLAAEEGQEEQVEGGDVGSTSDQAGNVKKARLAFLILSDGKDIGRLQFLLPQIKDPDNIYLVHVDAKTPRGQVETIRELVADTFPTVDGRPSNGALLEPAGIVSWGGFSLTLACLYGVAKALQWDDGWDYFINLSSADYPVLTQDEMKTLLGEYAPSRVSFMDGTLMTGYEKRWKGIVEDQGLQRTADSITFNAMTIMVETWRPHPQRFSLYKGEFWTILHRSFCEYVHKSPDNVARGLSAYFTGFRISDESYMQTVACHPQAPEFPIHGDGLRFNNWNEHHRDEDGRRVDANGDILLHPQPITEGNVPVILMSGALFSRKFVYSVNSVTAYNAISEELANDEKSGQRLDRARARIGRSPNEMVGRDEFCTPEEAVWVRRRLARLEKARKLGEGMIDGHSRWEKRKRRR